MLKKIHRFKMSIKTRSCFYMNKEKKEDLKNYNYLSYICYKVKSIYTQ